MHNLIFIVFFFAFDNSFGRKQASSSNVYIFYPQLYKMAAYHCCKIDSEIVFSTKFSKYAVIYKDIQLFMVNSQNIGKKINKKLKHAIVLIYNRDCLV